MSDHLENLKRAAQLAEVVPFLTELTLTKHGINILVSSDEFIDLEVVPYELCRKDGYLESVISGIWMDRQHMKFQENEVEARRASFRVIEGG